MLSGDLPAGVWAGIGALSSPVLIFIAAWYNLKVKGISIEDAARLADRSHFREEMIAVVKEAREDSRAARQEAKDARREADDLRTMYQDIHKALHDVVKESAAREAVLQRKLADVVELASEKERECKAQLADLSARLERHEKRCTPRRRPKK